MIDVCGREWLQDECERLKCRGLLKETQIVKVDGFSHHICQRCFNESEHWIGTFNYQNQMIRYCRKCLDFSLITDQISLYRSLIQPKISTNAYQLDVNFQLSSLQKQASNFAIDLLKKNNNGMIWAVCGASK